MKRIPFDLIINNIIPYTYNKKKDFNIIYNFSNNKIFNILFGLFTKEERILFLEHILQDNWFVK
jgi:hypothetical protein